MYQKVCLWVNQVSIYRPRSSGHLASSRRSSEGFFTKESGENTVSHKPQQVRTIVRNRECISTDFVFLEHFAWLCENFACSCEIEKHVFFQLLFSISPISSFLIHLHHLQFSSKAWSKCISSSSSSTLCPSSIPFFICHSMLQKSP